MTDLLLNEAGLAKAQRNKTIFNRALILIMREHGITREDALKWLDDDTAREWQPESEKHEFTD